MTDKQDIGIYIVTADYGYGPVILDDETWNDPAFAWQMADEIKAESDDPAAREATYGVCALVPFERPAEVPSW